MAKIRVFQHFCLSWLLNVSKKMPTLHFFCLRFCFCQHSLFQNQFLQNSWINRLLRWPKLQNRSWLEVFVVKEIKTANFVQKTQTWYSDETTYRFKQHYFYQTSLLNAKDVILEVILMFYNLTTILLNRIQRLKHVGNIKLEGCGFKPCQL